jgi:hypothetical protein
MPTELIKPKDCPTNIQATPKKLRYLGLGSIEVELRLSSLIA